MVFADICALLGLRTANLHINISLRDHYIWFKNPKVGSTTIGLTLQQAQKKQLPSLEVSPHPGIAGSLFTKPYQLPPGMLNGLLTGQSMVRFTFVRNPYVRLVSAYKEKILTGKPPKAMILKLLGRDSDDLTQDVTFDDFIDAVCRGEARRHDPHWMPQVLTTCARWIDMDFVGKLESFDADFRALCDQLPTNAVTPDYLNRTPHKTNASQTWQDFFRTAELAKRVATYYEEDFDTFHYATWTNGEPR